MMNWIRVLYFSNGLAFGVLFNWIPVLLEAKGFGSELIGLALGFGSLAFTFALPAWGHIGDIISGPRRALQLACVPAAAFGLGFILPLPFAAIVVCQVMVSGSGAPGLALTDAMVLSALPDPARRYPGLRLLASLGAGFGSIGCGVIYSGTGYLAAPLLFLVPIGLVFASAQFVPQGRDSERHRHARALKDGLIADAFERGRLGSVGEGLRLAPRLVAILASVVVMFVPVTIAATYGTLRIADLGSGAVAVGLLNGLASLAEVPGLVIGGWAVERFGVRPVLLCAALLLATCLLSWVWFVDPAAIIATRAVAASCFAAMLVPLVLIVARILPSRLVATGQTLLQAACWGMAALVANVLGGLSYSAFGPAITFGGAAVFAVAGALMLQVALPRGFETRSERFVADPGAVESTPGARPSLAPTGPARYHADESARSGVQEDR